ncbi:hypothetical protein EV424DRAFT_518450 [Suillus variegatus]|nr:hypothetical protein EV424DRAFT_518450 [Suillus variegatus]
MARKYSATAFAAVLPVSKILACFMLAGSPSFQLRLISFRFPQLSLDLCMLFCVLHFSPAAQLPLLSTILIILPFPQFGKLRAGSRG